MKAIYQILLTGIVLLLCGTNGYAFPYRFDNIHIDGTSAIYSFAQDKSGIMWLGTEKTDFTAMTDTISTRTSKKKTGSMPGSIVSTCTANSYM
jgi:hypothetical protein